MCVGPQPKFCTVSVLSLLDIFMMKYSHITILALFILASIDLIFTNKLITPKRFWAIFLIIIIAHTGFFFFFGCRSHCTFNAESIKWKLPNIEQKMRMDIEGASSYGTSSHEEWNLESIDKLCFRKPSIIEMYYNGRLMNSGTRQDTFEV